MTDYEDWYPIAQLAERLDVNYTTMHNWVTKAETNGFPAPKATQGKYRFYDLAEVQQWVFLRQRLSQRMGPVKRT